MEPDEIHDVIEALLLADEIRDGVDSGLGINRAGKAVLVLAAEVKRLNRKAEK